MDQPGPPGGARDSQAIAREHISLTPAGGGIGGMKNQYAEGLKILMATSGLVLLIACANIANLLLARGMKARIQISIRLALGAQRARLVLQALTESVALALAGGAAGVVVAWAGTHALLSLAFSGAGFVPIDARPSLPVLTFALLLSLLTGIIFGVLPEWRGARFDPIDALRGAGRAIGSRRGRPERYLEKLQSAVSLVPLAWACPFTENIG